MWTLPQTRVNEQGWLCVNKTLFKSSAIRLDLPTGYSLLIDLWSSPRSCSGLSLLLLPAALPAQSLALTHISLSFLQTYEVFSHLKILLLLYPLSGTFLHQTHIVISCKNLLKCHLLKEVSPDPPSMIPAFPSHNILYLLTFDFCFLVCLSPPDTLHTWHIFNSFLVADLSSQPRM